MGEAVLLAACDVGVVPVQGVSSCSMVHFAPVTPNNDPWCCACVYTVAQFEEEAKEAAAVPNTSPSDTVLLAEVLQGAHIALCLLSNMQHNSGTSVCERIPICYGVRMEEDTCEAKLPHTNGDVGRNHENTNYRTKLPYSSHVACNGGDSSCRTPHTWPAMVVTLVAVLLTRGLQWW